MDRNQVGASFRRYLLTSGKSSATATTYVSNVLMFFDWCARRECRPHDVDRYAVRDWIAERKETFSASRAHNDLASLKLFYRMLIEDNWRDDDPTQNLRVKRQKVLPTEPVYGGDFDAMLKACTLERDRVLLLMLAATGLRVSEMASLRCEDINWRDGTIKVFGKGGKERKLAPNPDVLARLRAFLGMFPEGPIWRSQQNDTALSGQQLRKIIYRIATAAKVEDIHPHRFRSMFATNYIEQFADIQALQGAMGHASIETTARYAEYTRERRQLEQMRRLNITDRLVG